MLISCFYLKEKCSGRRRRYLRGVCRAENGAGEAAGPGWLLLSWMPGYVAELCPTLGATSPRLCQGWALGQLVGTNGAQPITGAGGREPERYGQGIPLRHNKRGISKRSPEESPHGRASTGNSGDEFRPKGAAEGTSWDSA